MSYSRGLDRESRRMLGGTHGGRVSYVATVLGEVLYDGKLEPITAGVTYIADGHEIVRRHPHMFRRAGSMRFPRGVDPPAARDRLRLCQNPREERDRASYFRGVTDLRRARQSR